MFGDKFRTRRSKREFVATHTTPELEMLARHAASIACEYHPERNEDAYYMSRRSVGVFDDVGGTPLSEHASLVATEYCAEHFDAMPLELTPHEAGNALYALLRDANHAIAAYADASYLRRR